MSHLHDSLMETMYQLGSSASEIAAAVESLSPALSVPAEPVPERAFPDSFYLPKPIAVEEPPVEKRFVALSVADEDRYRQQWFTEQEARQMWKPYTPHVDGSGRCSCGHGYAEHLPCCVHLIEGCSCEEFHPVNAVAEGA